MPRVPVVLLSLILGAAAAVLISCGSSGGDIPVTSADAMLAQLQRARDGEAEGNCDKVASAAGEVQRLATSVEDGDVRVALQRGAGNLSQLASDPSACETTEKDTTEKETTTAPTTSTTTTTTKPPTTTRTTTETTGQTTTQRPPQPPSGGTGGAGGGGTGSRKGD